MDTQELGQKIRRACRNTIGDAVGRSVARNPEKDALIFGGRRWSYAELDAGANRVANALLARGLEKGDRVVAYGMNSDGYDVLWLGCLRAGLIQRENVNSMFAPPTVWISFLRHEAFGEHDLTSLQKVQYGASIMPVPV